MNAPAAGWSQPQIPVVGKVVPLLTVRFAYGCNVRRLRGAERPLMGGSRREVENSFICAHVCFRPVEPLATARRVLIKIAVWGNLAVWRSKCRCLTLKVLWRPLDAP